MPKRKSGQSPFCQFQTFHSGMSYTYHRYNSQKQGRADQRDDHAPSFRATAR
jgi:hypothetical protein